MPHLIATERTVLTVTCPQPGRPAVTIEVDPGKPVSEALRLLKVHGSVYNAEDFEGIDPAAPASTLLNPPAPAPAPELADEPEPARRR